jgi:hypothetical protein
MYDQLTAAVNGQTKRPAPWPASDVKHQISNLQCFARFRVKFSWCSFAKATAG